MAPESLTTNYAEIIKDLLVGIQPAAPLIMAFSKLADIEPPPRMMLRLKAPEKNIYINFAKDPAVVEAPGKEPEDVEMVANIDADMLHYLLWGKLQVARAVNEKALVVENNKTMDPEDRFASGSMAGETLLYNNPLYELYLIQIGADRLITDYQDFEIPEPGEDRKPVEIQLRPVPSIKFLGWVLNPLARVLGWVGGLALRVVFFNPKEEDLNEPLVYSTVPDPFPGVPPASSGLKLWLMKAVGRRMDIFAIIDNLAKGMMTTGPFHTEKG